MNFELSNVKNIHERGEPLEIADLNSKLAPGRRDAMPIIRQIANTISHRVANRWRYALRIRTSCVCLCVCMCIPDYDTWLMVMKQQCFGDKQPSVDRESEIQSEHIYDMLMVRIMHCA